MPIRKAGDTMSLNPAEISKLIKAQIQNIDQDLEMNETGTVLSIGDGISTVYGLKNAMMSELLLFPHDVYGMVMNLEDDHVGVVLMGDNPDIKEGDIVKRTQKIVEVPVGDEMIGRVINALGQPIDGKGPIHTTKTRPVERVAPGVMTRKSVSVPLQTGLKIIDSMIPIGRGQRELIIGDRQTGKTAIAIDTILNQKDTGVKCIYVAIGQKASTVAQIVEKLKQGTKKKVAFVGDGINDSPVLACADVGISMGNGSDIAIDTSDIVLMTDEPHKLVECIKISKKTKSVVIQNIVFALSIKVIVLVLSAMGISTMWEAIFADVGVSLLAIFNSIRIFKIK